MNSHNVIFDYRDEIFVKLARRLYIVHFFTSAKYENITFQHVALVDFLLLNEGYIDFLISNKTAVASDVLISNELLFSSNIDSGILKNLKDVMTSIVILQNLGHIEITGSKPELSIKANKYITIDELDAINEWKLKLSKIKPLIKKPIGTLLKKLLGGVDEQQPIFNSQSSLFIRD